MKKFAIAVIALAVLAVGMAMAVDPIPPTAETQGISTTTAVTCVGTVTNTETVVWTTSNQDLRNNPPLTEYWPNYQLNTTTGAIETGDPNFTWQPERQAVLSYTESIIADNGYTEFNEMQSVDTGAKTANQKNFASTEQFDFVASESAMGRLTFSESMLLDLASQGSDATERFICPFATGDQGYIPAYCNVYEMGSSFTGTAVTAIAQAGENHIAKAADVPTQLSYSIGLTGQGSAAAWLNAHVMEGRTGVVLGEDEAEDVLVGGKTYDRVIVNPDRRTLMDFMQGVDLVYKEKTTASGTIASFSKSISIQDAVRRL
ncbi:MAG: hypothetical protein QFX32_08665 [Methanolinea sp.]|nr:hypothetical protein [Methanolinea sp.]